MISVYVTDNNKKLVEEICASINDSSVAKVLGSSHLLVECREKLAEKTPDVLLLGLNLLDGSGLRFCAEVRDRYPDIKILALVTFREYSIVKSVVDNGAKGCILKNSLAEEVLLGIDTIMKGEIFLYDEIDYQVKGRPEEPVWLTPNELEVLRLIKDGYSDLEIADKLSQGIESIEMYRNILTMKLLVDGYSNKEIADKLHIDINTVRTYRMELIAKLGHKNSMNMVRVTSAGEIISTELTSREMQILISIAEGNTNKETADKLNLGLATVKTYRRDLLFKLGVKNTMTMVTEALRQGLIKL